MPQPQLPPHSEPITLATLTPWLWAGFSTLVTMFMGFVLWTARRLVLDEISDLKEALVELKSAIEELRITVAVLTQRVHALESIEKRRPP